MEDDRMENENKRKPGRLCKVEGGGERERSASVSSVRSLDEYVEEKGGGRGWEKERGYF